MSRIGKQPIVIPSGVSVDLKQNKKEYTVTVKGPKGELTRALPRGGVSITIADNAVVLAISSTDIQAKAMWGLFRTLISNMVVGVNDGFAKELEMKGVGYRAEMKGANLSIAAGFSHPVIIEPREGISFEVVNNVNIVVKGIDKELIGNVAAKIRNVRPPEPYKGKGIRYKDEVVRRKATKSLKK